MQSFHTDRMLVAGGAGFLRSHLFNAQLHRRNRLGQPIVYFDLLLERGTASYTT